MFRPMYLDNFSKKVFVSSSVKGRIRKEQKERERERGRREDESGLGRGTECVQAGEECS